MAHLFRFVNKGSYYLSWTISIPIKHEVYQPKANLESFLGCEVHFGTLNLHSPFDFSIPLFLRLCSLNKFLDHLDISRPFHVYACLLMVVD